MKAYVMTILLISAVSCGCLYLAAGKKYEKHLRYLSSLILLLALAAPLPKLFADPSLLPEVFSSEAEANDDSKYAEALKNASEKRLSEDLYALIANRCKLDENDFSVSARLTVSGRSFDLSEVGVTLCSAKAVLCREKIRDLVAQYCPQITFTEELKR